MTAAEGEPYTLLFSAGRGLNRREQGVSFRWHVPSCTRLTSLSRVQGSREASAVTARVADACKIDFNELFFQEKLARVPTLGTVILLKIHERVYILDLVRVSRQSVRGFSRGDRNHLPGTPLGKTRSVPSFFSRNATKLFERKVNAWIM